MSCDIDNAIKTLQAIKATAEPSERRIVVLDRGWVFIGDFTQEPGGDCLLQNAACIRKWGTTKGLPELQAGPLRDTVLDPCSLPVRFNSGAVVFMLDTSEGWNDAF